MDLYARAFEQPEVAAKSMQDPHPEFFDGTRVQVVSVQHNEQPLSGAYSYLQAVRDYACYVWVHKAVTVLANAIGALPVGVWRDQDPDDKHDISKLLSYVNDNMSSADLWTQWVVDMMLGGEEGHELVRKGKGGPYMEIWPRQPHTIFVAPDQAMIRYLGVAEYKIDDKLGKAYAVPPSEFIHYKFFNPANPWRGLTPFSAVRMGIRIDQFAQAWSHLFFRKSARPDYAVIAPQGIMPKEKEDLLKQLNADHRGLENAHQPIIMESGITDIKPLDFRPKDMEWMSQREMSRDEVGAIAGVPDEIMGWGRDTYENFDTAHFVLWTLTIMPIVARRDTQMTEFFQKQGKLKPNEYIRTDLRRVAVLQKGFGDKLLQAQILFQMGYPTNVINERLGLGMPELEGGDVGYLAFGLTPATSVKQLGSGRSSMVRHLVARSGQQAKRLQRSVGGPEYGSDEHQKLWNAFIKASDGHEKELGKIVRKLLERQQDEVVARLKRAGKDLLAGGQAKGVKSAQDVADNPFDKDEWEAEFEDETEPEIRSTVEDAGQRGLDDLELSIDFDISAPNVRKFIRQRVQRFAEEVNATTWERLQATLSAGLEAGDGIPKLIERVEEVMGSRIRSSGETIARTEVVGAYNGGTLESWKQSEVVDGKTWLAALDGRTRETHGQDGAHGQTVDIDDDFEVGDCAGPTPGQTGCGEEDVNCRCSMTAKINQRSWRRRRRELAGHSGDASPANIQALAQVMGQLFAMGALSMPTRRNGNHEGDHSEGA